MTRIVYIGHGHIQLRVIHLSTHRKATCVSYRRKCGHGTTDNINIQPQPQPARQRHSHSHSQHHDHDRSEYHSVYADVPAPATCASEILPILLSFSSFHAPLLLM